MNWLGDQDQASLSVSVPDMGENPLRRYCVQYVPRSRKPAVSSASSSPRVGIAMLQSPGQPRFPFPSRDAFAWFVPISLLFVANLPGLSMRTNTSPEKAREGWTADQQNRMFFLPSPLSSCQFSEGIEDEILAASPHTGGASAISSQTSSPSVPQAR